MTVRLFRVHSPLARYESSDGKITLTISRARAEYEALPLYIDVMIDLLEVAL